MMDARGADFRHNLEGLMTAGRQLPTLPVLMIQVQKALANEMTGLRELSAIIERDPALAARLLRAANSAAFSRGEPVTSIGAAVGRLGLSHVRSLCLAVGVVRAFGDSHHRLDHRRYWEHSAAVGLVADRLTRLSKRYARVDGAEAYVAGLLHDVGLLITDQFFPEDFAAVQEEMDVELVGRHQIELQRLGLDHGEVGGRLLGRWQLAPEVIAAVSHHHHPELAPEAWVPMANVIWAAEALCSAHGLDLQQEGVAEVAPKTALDQLDIDLDQREALLAEVGTIGERARQFTH
jgi:putative nucleotidyltransferase with HDIG domain